MRYLKELPVQLLITILTALALGAVFDKYIVSLFYTISSLFIEILIFILPFIVFIFIFRALVNIKTGSLHLILLIFGGVTLSNSIALFVAYFFGSTFLPLLELKHCCDFAAKFNSHITSLLSLGLPNIIDTNKAMIVGIVLGILFNFIKQENKIKKGVQYFSIVLSDGIISFLQKIFIPLLPLYVFGFCLKLSYDQSLIHLFEQYGKVFAASMFLVSLYIFLLYFIGSRGNLKKTCENLSIMAPAGLTGFSTMSSAMTMPVTLTCTEETTKDRHFTDLIIPSTANIHMLGDDLTIVMTALSLLAISGHSHPDLLTFIPFVLAFCLAKLSCVGIPGASVLVVLPVLQNFLGFTPEMISVLTTIYILQDSFGTAANVMGNGAFALLIQLIISPKKANG
jgi:Na+/H+-dicarboxylate symporter